jgi:glycosyltransferase involved in cell wall biosynthesis
LRKAWLQFLCELPEVDRALSLLGKTTSHAQPKLHAEVTERPPESDTPPMHILILGNNPSTLVNFNGALIETLLQSGHQVTTAGAGRDHRLEDWLAARNVRYVDLPIERAGLNPFTDVKTLIAFYLLMRRIKPDFLLAYMIKPVVYGLIAAWFAGVKRRAAIISGLGYAFTSDPDETGWLRIKRALVSAAARLAYFVALRLADTVIFQNPDDKAYFARMKLTRRAQRTDMVNGSGVDVAHYAAAPLPGGATTFLMIARLLRDKGVYEFVEAARIVRRSHPTARFNLVGPFDPNPSAIKASEVAAWAREGVVDYLGSVEDVRPQIANCHVFVLPSYREGTPRTVLEAMSMSRPIITTDVPGCRETVKDGENGFLVPAYDPQALANAMIAMVNQPDARARMARASLNIARTRFDAGSVAHATLQILGIRDEGPEVPLTIRAA